MLMVKLEGRRKLELCKIKRGPKIEVDGNPGDQWHNNDCSAVCR